MPTKPPPEPPAQATPKELQEYVQKMKEYAKQVEEQTNKEKIKMHSEVQKEKEALKQKEQDLKDAQEELKTKVRIFFNSRSRNKDKGRPTESQRRLFGNESKRFRERERRYPEGTR